MSVVSNVIFSFSTSENNRNVGSFTGYINMDAIDKWLAENDYGSFVLVESKGIGTVNFEKPIFAAAFKGSGFLSEFCTFVRSLKWKYPGRVQIIIQEEDDDKFRLIEPCK